MIKITVCRKGSTPEPLCIPDPVKQEWDNYPYYNYEEDQWQLFAMAVYKDNRIRDAKYMHQYLILCADCPEIVHARIIDAYTKRKLKYKYLYDMYKSWVESLPERIHNFERSQRSHKKLTNN